MRMILIVLALGASSAAAADWRSDPPTISTKSTKTLDELSGCYSAAWEHRSGQTTYVAIPRGFTMRLTYNIFDRSMVAAQIDVHDNGAERIIEVRAPKADRGKKLTREIEGCV